MNTQPRVLILLATFNGESHLEKQIASIAAQTEVTPVVFLRDDASSDCTVKVGAQLLHSYGIEHKITIGHQQSGSAARNFFQHIAKSDLATADFVALCDQDDIWHPGKLARAIDLLLEHESDFYSSNSRPFWPDGRSTFVRKNYKQQCSDFLFESASHGCTYVFTHRVAEQLQQFVRGNLPSLTEIAYHDWLIYAWARQRKFPWIMDDQALIDYRQSGSNVIGANVGLGAARQRAALLRSGWLRQQALLIAHALDMPRAGIVAQLDRFSLTDRLALAVNCFQCRRRPRDAFVFALTMLLGRKSAGLSGVLPAIIK